jgi:hypothetical protein
VDNYTDWIFDDDEEAHFDRLSKHWKKHKRYVLESVYD